MILADGGQVAEVRATTGGRGANVVLDFVGEGTTPADGLAMLARGGCYVAIGYGGRLEVDTADLVVGEFTVTGSLVGTITELEELVALAARSHVSVTTRPYPLDDIHAAMSDLRSGEIRGRAVIVP